MNLLKRVKSNSLYKTGLSYSLVSSCKSFVTMGVGILIMRWLQPSELGLWNAVSIFQAYVPFFQFGIQSGLNRDLPILLGEKNNVKAEELVANAKGFAYILSIVFILLGFLLSSFFYLLGKEISFIAGIFTVAIMAASMSLQLHLVATFRSARAFDRLTRVYIIDTILIFLLVYFIYKYHYYGILIYNSITYIVSASLMAYYAPYKHIRPQIRKKPLVYLGKVGLVLMSFIQLRGIAQSIPRWIILSVGGVVKLGLFSPAMAINGVMNMLPNQIAQFFHPQMGFKYGTSGCARDLWPYVKKIVLWYPLLTLPICICIWILAPWLLNTFFPKYIESLWPMRIMALGFVFSGAFTTHGILYTIKAYKPAYLYSFIELVGYFIWPYLVICIFHIDALVSVCIGLAFNQVLLYVLNICILKKVLFFPCYNLNKD